MHYLIVTEPEIGYFEYEIEHEENCPTEIRTYGFFDGIDREYEDYICNVNIHIDSWGFVDLEEDERFKTIGKYPIDWYGYFPTSAFEDNDVYIFFVEENLVA